MAAKNIDKLISITIIADGKSIPVIAYQSKIESMITEMIQHNTTKIEIQPPIPSIVRIVNRLLRR